VSKFKEILISLRNVTPAAWVRLAVLVASVIGVAVRLFGGDFSAENEEMAKDIAAVAVLIISSATAYWKNNSFTEAAQAADAILAVLKRNK
jgi:diacylglycerol kinase